MCPSKTSQMPLRIPSTLHTILKEMANLEGVSLNQYCLFLLANSVAHHDDWMKKKAENLLRFLEEGHLLQEQFSNQQKKKVTEAIFESPSIRFKKLYGKSRTRPH